MREAANRYGSQCIVVAIDAKNVARKGEPPRWEIFTHGGRKPTGIEAIGWASRSWCRWAPAKCALTSMDTDGTKSGFDLKLTRAMSQSVDVRFRASGGVGKRKDLHDGLEIGWRTRCSPLNQFFRGTYTIQQAKGFRAERGVVVRDPIYR